MRCGVEKQSRPAARGPALDTRALPRFTPLSQRPARFPLLQALQSDRASHRAEPRLPRRRLAAAEVTAKPSAPPRRTRKKKMGRTTAADKKKMLLKIYHTKKEPFNLKELTKLAKAAGLAEKLVQDVNTQLMDDNYVSSDKIGTGNYFWAFPGSQGAQAKKQLDEVRCAASVETTPSRCWRRVDGVEGSHHAIEANSRRESREPHRPRRT